MSSSYLYYYSCCVRGEGVSWNCISGKLRRRSFNFEVDLGTFKSR